MYARWVLIDEQIINERRSSGVEHGSLIDDHF